MVDLSEKYLLMIEPQQPCTGPINDLLSGLAAQVYLSREDNTSIRYRGFHTCSCGRTSDNIDHVLPGGVITNSLMFHYIRDHRSEVPDSEIKKLKRIGDKLGIRY